MDILMPQLGETVAEGKITVWFKSVGDAVKPGENLFEIETDKTSMEVPATSAGVLAAINVPAGEIAAVGAVVAIVADAAGGASSAASDRAAAAPSPVTAPATPKAPTAPAQSPITPVAAKNGAGEMNPFFEVRTPDRHHGPATIAGGIVVTPLARRLATEFGIDLTRVKGSGPRGRIVARDIESSAASGAGRATAPLAAGPSAEQVMALYREVPFEEVPHDTMRKTIATRLVEAKQTVPHFYLTSDLEIDRLIRMREEANAAAPKDAAGNPAYKLSLNDFIIKAWAAALQRVPAANAIWAGDRILRFRHSDIGVAVALEGGLITPVVRQAEAKMVTAISAEMRDLAAKARERKLKPQDYQGGSSAISNLGMYGIREFSAIINPPHATILAVGTARRAPVETEDGGVRFVSQMTVTLSCDHRVVDGALGAELLAAFRGFIEQPVTALV